MSRYPVWPTELPNGLYVRDYEREPPGGRSGTTCVQRWTITGRNPDFWWDIVITTHGPDYGAFELHCTRCSHRDCAPSMRDVLSLIRFGAHFHDTDAAGDLDLLPSILTDD